MDYDKALSFIIKKQSLGIKPGLSRIEKILSEMGNPQNKLNVIHIAGTNGKGTVAAALANTLAENGKRVGLFTSPWIEDYREQIQINGKKISKVEFARYVTENENTVATEFELLTAIMYKYFYDKKVDFAVVECGMGGLEDSTNAVESPVLSVITSVALDHTDFLGRTIEEIAYQKAGIIKKNSAVVLYPNEKCEKVFEDKCRKENSVLMKVNETGSFRNNNLETVNKCLAYLGFDAARSLAFLPARQELIGGRILLDGSHNEDGALALLNAIPKRNITAVIGMLRDKSYDSYLSHIAPLCDKIYTVTVSNPRSLSADELCEAAEKYCKNVVSCADPHKAVKLAGDESNFLLVCGSFYLAREIRKDLI